MRNRLGGSVTLDSIFNATSVAIAGVTPGNAGQVILDILLDFGFKGKIYPVDPKGGEVAGLQVYDEIRDVPEPLDYVISCVAAGLTPRLINDCTTKGVKAVCILAAGFSESGTKEGRDLEKETTRLARASGLRILGPNCLGVYSPRSGLSFSSDFPKEGGRVALICQSGGDAIYLTRAAAQKGIRFTKVVSYGNACDIDESDLLDYFSQDPETEIVAAYIDGIKDSRRFQRVLKELSTAKPVIALKAGYIQAGVTIVSPHADALAGSHEIWEGLLRQSGVVCTHGLEELIDMLVTFCYLRPPRGRNVAIYGGGGGFSVLAVDQFAAVGFVIPPLTQQIQEKVNQGVKDFASSDAGFLLSNPIDVGTLMSCEGHYNILKALATYDGLDLLVIQLSLNNSEWPQTGSAFSIWPDLVTDAIIKFHGEVNTPMAVVLHGIVSSWDLQRVLDLQVRYYEAGLPVYRSAASAAKAIDRFLCYHERHPS